MYILLYVNACSKPSYIEGSIEQINTELRRLWENDDIDHEDWAHYSNYELLYIEDGALTEVNQWELTSIPQFTVS